MRPATVRGFTLAEMLVVLAIAALLAVLAYPSYMDFMRKGWRSEGRAALMQQMQEQERGYTRTGRYQPYEGDSEGGGRYTLRSGHCEGRTSIDSCVRLTATLKPGFSDPQVGDLWLDSTGARGCNGTQAGRCWQ